MYDFLGGYLLLCSHLGNTRRRPLKHRDFHKFLALGTDVRGAVGMKGCPAGLEELLGDEPLMQLYARDIPGDITPILLSDGRYPQNVRQRLGTEAAGILWARGNLELLDRPAVALVGSRKLTFEGERFAAAVGRMAARKGWVLVSGNASGTDSIGQQACLEAGGCVISVVADSLLNKRGHDRLLWLSEDDFDMDFSSDRALSRNQVIHSLGMRTYVAQSEVIRSGTWSGVTRNLKGGWTPVCMHSNGSEAARQVLERGGTLVRVEELETL